MWDSTGLVYLRARMYQPTLGIFLSRDPLLASSPYRYAGSNPVNRVDPSGYVDCSRAEIASGPAGSWGYCQVETGEEKVWDVARKINAALGRPDNAADVNAIAIEIVVANGLGAPPNTLVPGQRLILKGEWIQALGSTSPLPSPTPYLPPIIHPGPPGPPPGGPPAPGEIASLFSDIDGYIEGIATSGTAFFCQMFVEGTEIVYDFRSGERALFRYTGAYGLGVANQRVGPTGANTALFDYSTQTYAGPVWGFTGEEEGLRQQYSGHFWSGSSGASIGIARLRNLGANVSIFSSVDAEDLPNFKVWGVAVPVGGGAGWSPFLILSTGVVWTDYTMDVGSHYSYGRDAVSLARMAQDVIRGTGSPLSEAITPAGIDLRRLAGEALLRMLR